MFYFAAIYRGCTDGFTDVPSLQHSYVGCRNQTWNNRNLRWCICNTTLCNGDSLESMARRKSYARHRLTAPPVPSYRRPKARQVPVEDDEVHGGSSVAEDDAKAGLNQPWNPEPIYHGGPYLWNPNNRPFRMSLSSRLFVSNRCGQIQLQSSTSFHGRT